MRIRQFMMGLVAMELVSGGQSRGSGELTVHAQLQPCR